MIWYVEPTASKRNVKTNTNQRPDTMKRTTLILIALISISILSCKSDDDNDSSTSSNNALVGTTWNGQEEAFGIYTFSSNTKFRFVDPNETPVDGTYTFDGNDGVLTEETGFVAPFNVAGGIMSVEGVNSTRVYIRQ